MSTLPNFLIVGPPRTATTWLYKCLDNHPDVFVPNIKEARYFDEHFQKKDFAWYKSLYAECPDSITTIGDITPGYFAHEDVPSRIYNALGADVKLLIIFRDPLDRAVSHYNVLRNNKIVEETFQEHLERKGIAYQSSMYAKNIERYIAVFGRANIRIFSYSELAKSPHLFWQKVQSSLGLIEKPDALIENRVNERKGRLRSGLLFQIVEFKRKIERISFFRKILWLIRDHSFVKKIKDKSRGEAFELKLSPLEREELSMKFFQDEMDCLDQYKDLFQT